MSVYYSYNSGIAHKECLLIDPNWGIVDSSNSATFCPLNLQKIVIDLIESHLSCHMLLPKSDGSFVKNANEIWIECIGEIFQFCKNDSLLQLWIYL